MLDTATPLTMVLSETSNGQTSYYWQGLDTLAQSDGTTTRYFGYDGLGSVRQLTDSTGAVGLAQTFDPYGNPYAKAGTAASSLGFTGEQTDSDGFVYLRARYYNSSAGRFLNTDPSRLEMNPYHYAMANPVMYVDPTGYSISQTESVRADAIIDGLLQAYGIQVLKDYGWLAQTEKQLEHQEPADFYPGSKLPSGVLRSDCRWVAGNWTLDNLEDINKAVGRIRDVLQSLSPVGADNAITKAFGGVLIVTTILERSDQIIPGQIALGTHDRHAGGDRLIYTVIHELAHLWDRRTSRKLSNGLAEVSGRKDGSCNGYTYNGCFRPGEAPPGYIETIPLTSIPDNPYSPYNYAARGGPFSGMLEDIAESFAAYIMPSYFELPGYQGLSTSSNRWKYMNLQIKYLAEGHPIDSIANYSFLLPRFTTRH